LTGTLSECKGRGPRGNRLVLCVSVGCVCVCEYPRVSVCACVTLCVCVCVCVFVCANLIFLELSSERVVAN
jgi:hypothetical protein